MSKIIAAFFLGLMIITTLPGCVNSAASKKHPKNEANKPEKKQVTRGTEKSPGISFSEKEIRTIPSSGEFKESITVSGSIPKGTIIKIYLINKDSFDCEELGHMEAKVGNNEIHLLSIKTSDGRGTVVATLEHKGLRLQEVCKEAIVLKAP